MYYETRIYGTQHDTGNDLTHKVLIPSPPLHPRTIPIDGGITRGCSGNYFRVLSQFVLDWAVEERASEGFLRARSIWNLDV